MSAAWTAGMTQRCPNMVPQSSNMLYKSHLAVCMMVLVATTGAAGRSSLAEMAQRIIYVNPSGHDTNSGTTPDQALRTIAQAQKVVRTARLTPEGSGQFEVRVAPGSYPQENTLVFDQQHDSNVKWIGGWTAASEGGSGESELSFGIPVQGGWEKGEGSLWHRQVAEVASGIYPRQMWNSNGERMQRARSPNGKEYYRYPLEGALLPDTCNQGFYFPHNTLDSNNWTEIEDMEIITFASWTSSRHYISQLNMSDRSVRFTSPCGFNITAGWPNSGNRFYAENAVEMLDTEGEWYISKKSGTLTLFTASDPNTRGFVLDRGEAVDEGILIKATERVNDVLVHPSKRASNTSQVKLSPTTTNWGNSSFKLSMMVVAQPGTKGILFFKGPEDHSHVPGDKTLSFDSTGNVILDMGWVGRLSNNQDSMSKYEIYQAHAYGASMSGVNQTLITTQSLVGTTPINDGKLHSVTVQYNKSTNLIELLVDGIVEAHNSTFPPILSPGDLTNWTILLGLNMTKNSYVTNAVFESFEARQISSLELSGNFAIRHVGWALTPWAVTDFQAVSYLETAAVHLHYCSHCTISGMSVQHTGGNGMWIEGGSNDVLVTNVLVTDLGAGGLRVGRGIPLQNEPADQTTHHVTVNNSRFLRGSAVYEAGNGILLQNSPYFTLTQSEIGYFDHVGVTIGWVWGYFLPPATHNNVVAYNYVHHSGNGILSDLGGIYALGFQPGTRIHHNLVHDSYPFFQYGHGIYLDEGSSGITVEKNWVHSAFNAHFLFHYGVNNTIKNNVFAKSLGFCQRYAMPYSNQSDEHCPGYIWDPAYRNQSCSYNYTNNIVAIEGQTALVHTGPEGWCNATFDNNLYYNFSGRLTDSFPGPKSHKFPGYPDGLNYRSVNESFHGWTKSGNDHGSEVENPMFISQNPTEDNDFRLQPDSPAIKSLGFENFDLRSVIGPDWD